MINGNFDISQRYGPLCSVVVPNAATYVIDRWFTLRDGDNATVRVKHMAFAQGQTDVSGEPTYYFRFEQSVAGSNGNYNDILHSIEDVRTLASQTWSASFWAKADSTRQVEFFPTLYFGAGSGGRYDSNRTTFTLSTSWEKFTANGTMPGISGITLGAGHCTQLLFSLIAMNTVQTIDIAQVQFEPGSYDSPFQKKSFGEELEACKRYYQKSFPYATPAAQNTGVTNGTFRWTASKTNASTNYSSSFSLPVQMRITPSVTLYNPNAANAQVYNTDCTNSGTSTAATSGIVSESVLGFNTTGVSGWAVGDRLSLHWATDAELYL